MLCPFISSLTCFFSYTFSDQTCWAFDLKARKALYKKSRDINLSVMWLGQNGELKLLLYIIIIYFDKIWQELKRRGNYIDLYYVLSNVYLKMRRNSIHIKQDRLVLLPAYLTILNINLLSPSLHLQHQLSVFCFYLQCILTVLIEGICTASKFKFHLFRKNLFNNS